MGSVVVYVHLLNYIKITEFLPISVPFPVMIRSQSVFLFPIYFQQRR